MDSSQVLGVEANAPEEEIRAAYLRKVKEHPPESSPEEFEKIRDAYEALRSPRRRARSMLFADPEAPMASLLGGRPNERSFVGPSRWLGALKKTAAKRTPAHG